VVAGDDVDGDWIEYVEQSHALVALQGRSQLLDAHQGNRIRSTSVRLLGDSAAWRGQVCASADSGDSWQARAQHFPAVLSIEVQALP
jgi:hypothetical protein